VESDRDHGLLDSTKNTFSATVEHFKLYRVSWRHEPSASLAIPYGLNHTLFGQAARADFIVIFITHCPRTNYSASCQVSGAGGMRNQICKFKA
jgi:hypothetical protein